MNGKIRSAAFKKKVALEAIREEKTLNEIAKEYDVHPVQVCKWKKELLDGAEVVFNSDKKKSFDHTEKVASLERKIGQLAMENEWLKKKLGLLE